MIVFLRNGNLLLLGFGLIFLYASVNWLESYLGKLVSFSIGMASV